MLSTYITSLIYLRDHSYIYTPIRPCTVKDCGECPFVVGLKNSDQSASHGFGGWCKYECQDDDQYVEGNSTIVCQDTAEWQQVPQCKRL